MPQRNDVFVRSAAPQERSYRKERVEPAARLINRLADVVGRERFAFVNESLVLKRIMPLREWHGAGIKPHVNHLFDPRHLTFAFPAREFHAVNHRPVEIRIRREHIVPDFFLIQLRDTANDLDVLTASASPDGERRPPVSLAREGPVFDAAQPLAEAPLLYMRRYPPDGARVFEQLFVHFRHANPPRTLGVIKKRSGTAPTERIVVRIAFGFEKKSAFVQIIHHLRVGVFYKQSGPRRDGRNKLSFFIYGF